MSTFLNCFFCLAIMATLTAQPTSLTSADFQMLSGLYTGHLTYTDYQSDELVAMPLVANLIVDDKKVAVFIEINEGGRRYPQDMSLQIKDGAIKGWTTERNAIDEEGTLVLTKEGRDASRPARFRLTLAGNETGLLITKEVRFQDGGDQASDYFVRNQYALERYSRPTDRPASYLEKDGSDAGVANVTIPARQEFVLGEAADYAFKARLQNQSGVPIDVRVVNSASGEQTSGFGLGKYGKARIEVAADQQVRLVNASDQPVTIRVGLNRNVAGMRYLPVEQK